MDMMEWQLRGYRDHFTTLLGRPWFEDGLDRREHLIVYKMMSEITSEDRQASSQILNMPFLETIGKGDLFIVDILYAAALGMTCEIFCLGRRCRAALWTAS